MAYTNLDINNAGTIYFCGIGFGLLLRATLRISHLKQLKSFVKLVYGCSCIWLVYLGLAVVLSIEYLKPSGGAYPRYVNVLTGLTSTFLAPLIQYLTLIRLKSLLNTKVLDNRIIWIPSFIIFTLYFTRFIYGQLDSWSGNIIYTEIRTTINGARILFESIINLPVETLFLYKFWELAKTLQIWKVKSTDRVQYQIKLYSLEVLLTMAVFIDSFIAVINPAISVLQPMSPLIIALKWSDLLEFGLDIEDILKIPQVPPSIASEVLGLSVSKTV